MEGAADKERRFYTPENLAKQLVEDGLQNVACNVRLLCCFGGGVFDADQGAQQKSVNLGMPLTPLAMRLAYHLGSDFHVNRPLLSPTKPLMGTFRHSGNTDPAAVGIRVSGYRGATNSNTGVFTVDLNANKNYADAERHVWWYDLSCKEQPEGNPEGNDAAGAGVTGLAGIQAGDVLYIMSHGDWKSGGRFLPDSGGTGLLAETLEDVNRIDRMNGNEAVVKNIFTEVAKVDLGRFAKRWPNARTAVGNPPLPEKGSKEADTSNQVLVAMSRGRVLQIRAFNEQGVKCWDWDEESEQLTFDQNQHVEWLKKWWTEGGPSSQAVAAKNRAAKLAQPK